MTIETFVGGLDDRVLDRHRRLAELPQAWLEQEALKMLRYELDLPSDERRRRVVERFRAWLLLERQDARRVAEAFASASWWLAASERETMTETENDAVMDGLSFDEFRQLADFVPALRKWRNWAAANTPDRGVLPRSFAAALALSGTA